jgi:hypothetical protein
MIPEGNTMFHEFMGCPVFILCRSFVGHLYIIKVEHGIGSSINIMEELKRKHL